MDDDNKKKPDGSENDKMASNMVLLQSKIMDFQSKLKAITDKVYTGRYKGVTIQMRGDFLVVDVKIDQSVYESASKEAIEQAFLVCLTNLHNAIKGEIDALNAEMKNGLNLSGMPQF